MAASVTQLPVLNALTGSLPCEGAKALPYTMDFSATNEYDFDFTAQYQQGQFTTVQGCFIDNSLNAATLIITIDGTNQTIVVPKNSCGYYVFLTTTPPKLKITSTGNVSVYVAFINFYVPPTVWSV